MESDFQIFQIPDPRKSVLGPGVVFGNFCRPKIIALFTILSIFYNFWKMFHKTCSYEPSRQYGISPFSKVPYLIVSNLRNQSTIYIMTTFLQCFEFPPKSVLLHFGTSRARLEKCMMHSARKFREQI